MKYACIVSAIIGMSTSAAYAFILTNHTQYPLEFKVYDPGSLKIITKLLRVPANSTLKVPLTRIQRLLLAIQDNGNPLYDLGRSVHEIDTTGSAVYTEIPIGNTGFSKIALAATKADGSQDKRAVLKAPRFDESKKRWVDVDNETEDTIHAYIARKGCGAVYNGQIFFGCGKETIPPYRTKRIYAPNVAWINDFKVFIETPDKTMSGNINYFMHKCLVKKNEKSPVIFSKVTYANSYNFIRKDLAPLMYVQNKKYVGELEDENSQASQGIIAACQKGGRPDLCETCLDRDVIMQNVLYNKSKKK